MSLEVITFGCRLNTYESSIIKYHAKKAGLKNAIILNSCAVTQQSEKKLQQIIRKIRKTQPEKKILVTGCAAQISPVKYQNIADAVFGNYEKLQENTYKILQNTKHHAFVGNIMTVTKITHKLTNGLENRTRAFLQIQNGCNHRCTFCVIPYGRGNSRSVPVAEIVRTAKRLVYQGYKELVLTGVDITNYGYDLPGQPNLGNMIDRLLKTVPTVLRLRLSSIDVAEIDRKLIELMTQHKCLMPYIHLSLQSGDDIILKRMKRRHNAKQVYDFCHTIWSKRPEVMFGADIITGFPTEDKTMFYNTVKLIEELNIVHLHIFPYSQRNNTTAARMKQIHFAVINDRAQKLQFLKYQLLSKHLNKKIGTKQLVLIESNGQGLTEDYCRVQINTYKTIGEIHSLYICSVKNGMLVAST